MALVALAVALASLLPDAVRVALIVGAFALALMDLAGDLWVREVREIRTVERIVTAPPPEPFVDPTIVTEIPPVGGLPPHLGVPKMFSAPGMRV